MCLILEVVPRGRCVHALLTWRVHADASARVCSACAAPHSRVTLTVKYTRFCHPYRAALHSGCQIASSLQEGAVRWKM